MSDDTLAPGAADRAAHLIPVPENAEAPGPGDFVAPATTRPILPSADLPATIAFYARFGFGVVGHWPEEYLILTGPDTIELHFWFDPGVDRRTNDVGCWIGYPTEPDLRARYAAWARVDVPAPADLRPVDAVGPVIEFQLIDLHGNLLRIGSPHRT